MTLALTYNGDLSRVQLALSSIAQDTVRIERSTNELFWEIVRGGTEVPISAGAAALDDFEFAAESQNFYRVLDIEDLEGAPVESDDIAPSLAGAVWLKSIRYPLLNHVVTLGDYSDLERPARTGVSVVSGRSFPVGVTDVNLSIRYSQEFVTDTAEAIRKLDLAVALGDILFLHIPPGNVRRPPRSMYAVPDSSRITRIGTGGRRRTTVPLTEVAPPGPDVVGTTLTWGTVWNNYASWTQLWAASPDWTDLLATVGSPDDLVVI